MIEAEWWEYDSHDELGEAVAGDIAFIVEQALDARGGCVLALAGGRTPFPAYRELVKKRLAWKDVVVVPGDDRLVPPTDPLSNVAGLAKLFLPVGARVVPLAPDGKDYKTAGKAADARLQDLHWPPDLVLLGMGGDGHTASIFPGPDYDEALNGPSARRAVGVMPDPLPPEAPVPRVTLTKSAIVSAKTLMIVITGQEKREVLEKALAGGASSNFPIGRVLADAEMGVDVHWAP